MTRLTVNINEDVVKILEEQTARQDISVTEATRRAFAVWNFLLTEIAAGNTIAVIEEGHRICEVVMVGTDLEVGG